MKATGIVRRVDNLGRIVIPQGNQKNPENPDGRPLSYNSDIVRLISAWHHRFCTAHYKRIANT